MKLYHHPVSTTSRPVVLFAAENDIALELQTVDLFTGEHLGEAFGAINPSRLVPMLDDDGFRLTESSAILKYLADKIGSPAYPMDLRRRARVNERMDWFNTNFYRDFGYGLVYPQVLPTYKCADPAHQAATLATGRERCRRWLKVLDEALIGPGSAYLCGDEITIADYLGSGIITLGDWIGCTFEGHPNVQGWVARMKALPSWKPVHEAFDGLCASLKGGTYETV